jgi:molybdopterin converting factor small subunit
MSVKVLIPYALRSHMDNRESVEIEAETVAGLLDTLVGRHDGLRALDEDGGLRSAINIYVNDENIQYLDGDDTALESGDVVTLVLAIAGG